MLLGCWLDSQTVIFIYAYCPLPLRGRGFFLFSAGSFVLLLVCCVLAVYVLPSTGDFAPRRGALCPPAAWRFCAGFFVLLRVIAFLPCECFPARGVSRPGATYFANSGKVGKAPLRPRKLRIAHPFAGSRARSLRCSSFPHATRCAGLARGPRLRP